MSLTSLLTKTCTIVSRVDSGVSDAYGNEVDTTTTSTVACAIQQVTRREDDGTLSDTTLKGYFPTGTVLGTDDAVIESGIRYEVVGQPWDFTEGSSSVNHVEATLRRVAGGQD